MLPIPPSCTFARMQLPDSEISTYSLRSDVLDRTVQLNFYWPSTPQNPAALNLLLINDGQNMEEMGLRSILDTLYANASLQPVLCVAIHAGENRKREYGVADQPDYLGRGDLAAAYAAFVMTELLPLVHQQAGVYTFKQAGFAGFSLGGLQALDMVWKYPGYFNLAGVFSGALWWRNLDQEDPAYSDDSNRIIHQEIRNGSFHPGLRFFFQCGNKDETADRNGNGIIDSIDDTRDLISELKKKGYTDEAICYLEMPDGKHDIPTWALAMPAFLQWAFPL